ncbi:hypothetical protein [Phage DSL-LC04]|nr:hypothetical protein [Phage DSL-LC04]
MGFSMKNAIKKLNLRIGAKKASKAAPSSIARSDNMAGMAIGAKRGGMVKKKAASDKAGRAMKKTSADAKGRAMRKGK